MRLRRWLPVLILLLAAALVWADEAPREQTGVLQSIADRISGLRDAFENWRRAPFESLERDFNTRQAALEREIRGLENELDVVRTNLLNVQLTPGPAGPRGPAGPAGPRGHAGLPGNLQLAGEACPAGQAVSGFDALGNLLCAAASNAPGTSLASSPGTGSDCQRALVTAADLRRCDLRRQQLGGRDLSFATLVKADLRTSLQGTDFTGADLRRADMSGADLYDVVLVHANLTLARMGSVRIEGGDLSGAVLRRAEMALARTIKARFLGADLTDAGMSLSQHYGSDFTRADLSGADLRQSVFQDSNLFLATTSSSLDQARMINTICPDGTNSSANANSCIGHTLRQ